MSMKPLFRWSLSALALVFAAVACDQFTPPTGNDSDDGQDLVPASLEIVEGDGVTQTVGTDVTVTVRVVDDAGTPVAQVAVSWSVGSGGGSLAAGSTTTDSSGVTGTTWTLGTETGTQTVTASASSGTLTATFTATATAGDIASVELAADSGSFSAFGDTLALSATATDEFGNEYSDATYTWTTSDTAVVTVTSMGQVVSTGNGNADVMATANGVSDTASITVMQAVDSLGLALDADTANFGQTVGVALSYKDANGYAITDSAVIAGIGVVLSTSDTTTAAVTADSSGVEAVGLGLVTVSATTPDSIVGSDDLFNVPDPTQAISATSSVNGCALDLGGQAWCWGSGGNGELGNGTNDHSNTPVQVSGGHSFVALSSNVHSYCGLTDAGEIYCWGWNGIGSIGIGVLDDQVYNTPQKVASNETFTALDGDWYHFCAVADSGDVYCWGYNRDGGIGVDPATGPETCVGFGGVPCASSPVLADGQHTYTDVAVGYFHSCAIDDAGDTYCWGTNYDGQFGNGNTSSITTATAVAGPAGMNFAFIDANWSHTCGITDADELYCWGHNNGGRLGDGTETQRLSPVLVTTDGSTSSWSTVSASNGYTCGTTTSNDGYCWGFNSNGKLGTGDWFYYTSPANIAGGHAFTAVSAGFTNACALTDSGTPYCWGFEDFGALGNGQWPTIETPASILGGLTLASVSSGVRHTCAVDGANDAWCWGIGFSGELGNGGNVPEAQPMKVSGGLAFDQVDGGWAFTCGLTTGGAAYCWGNDAGNALGDGDGSITDKNTPAAVAGGHTFTDVSSGGSHSCAIDNSGVAWCWGNNPEGALGDGMTEESATPVQVADTFTYVQIAAGAAHSCGLTNQSEIYCWGSDGNGQLGTTAVADTSMSWTPVKVDGSQTWSSVSIGANGSYTCAITNAAELYCWGANGSGQLGNGTTDQAGTPTLVSGGHSWASVAAGGSHTCGVTTSDAAYCWGWNGGAQLGLGFASGSPELTPQAVQGGYAFAQVTVGGGSTSCGMTTANEGLCWGYEGYGELGTGDWGVWNSPQQTMASFTAPTWFDFTTGGILTASRTGPFQGIQSSGQLMTGSDWIHERGDTDEKEQATRR